MELIFEIFAATQFRPINLNATAPKKHCFKLHFFFLFSCISFEHDLWKTKKRISLKESCKDHRPTTLLLFYNTEPENRSRELYRRNTDDWRGWLYNLLQSTPISIRSPQKVRGNKVITNLVADGSWEEIEQDWCKNWASELLEQVHVAGRIYCGAPGSFHGVLCNCLLINPRGFVARYAQRLLHQKALPCSYPASHVV